MAHDLAHQRFRLAQDSFALGAGFFKKTGKRWVLRFGDCRFKQLNGLLELLRQKQLSSLRYRACDACAPLLLRKLTLGVVEQLAYAGGVGKLKLVRLEDLDGFVELGAINGGLRLAQIAAADLFDLRSLEPLTERLFKSQKAFFAGQFLQSLLHDQKRLAGRLQEDFLGLGDGGVDQLPRAEGARLQRDTRLEMQQRRLGGKLLDGALHELRGAVIVLGRQAVFDLGLNLLDQLTAAFLFLAGDGGLQQGLCFRYRRIDLADLTQNLDGAGETA